MAVENLLPLVTPNAPHTLGVSKTNKSRGDLPRDTVIIDIRKDREEQSILENIKSGLRPGIGQEKTLPTLLLYDVAGLNLFEKITYLEEYYLTNTEIDVLEKYADHIAERIQPNSIIVELGSG
jgi:L-histidine Nalpha-methyltransferase / hercynylcysteine S-oxide synthase